MNFGKEKADVRNHLTSTEIFQDFIRRLRDYPTARFVVVEVHKTPTLFSGSSFVVLFPLTNIHKALREPERRQ